MKKFLNFLRSMTFGVILLALVCGISVIGSLIEQNQTAMYYVTYYENWYQVILALSFDHIFSSWYFIVIVVLLCINLTFCSIVRFRSLNAADVTGTARMATADVLLDEEGLEKAKRALEKRHCRKIEDNGRVIYSKNQFGRYGTFITHLGILLTVIFFALALTLPTVTDQTCMPGESVTMEDGTEIAVESFRIEDEEGNLDYTSEINITLADGRNSGTTEISVNYPASFGSYKVYQQTYGTVGIITVTDEAGNSDRIVMDESHMFLSKDGVTGIWFNELYPDFVQGESGAYSLITSTTGSYKNPVYTFNEVVYSDESEDELVMTPMLAFPGDEITIGELTFHFDEPVEYPGLRIKYSPAYAYYLLVFAFIVMIAGFAVTFLMTPVCVVITDDGYRVMGNRSEGIRLMLRSVTAGHVKDKHTGGND